MPERTDRELAIAFAKAETGPTYDTEEFLFAENDILQRLDLPLDETCRGLTPAAVKAVDEFVDQQIPELNDVRSLGTEHAQQGPGPLLLVEWSYAPDLYDVYLRAYFDAKEKTE